MQGNAALMIISGRKMDLAYGRIGMARRHQSGGSGSGDRSWDNGADLQLKRQQPDDMRPKQ